MITTKHILYIAGVVSLVLTFSGCKEKNNAKYDQSIDDKIRIKISTCPDSAKFYIDEAIDSQSISERHGDYLYAITMSRYKKDYYNTIDILKELDTYYEKNKPECEEDSVLYRNVLKFLSKNYFNVGQYAFSMKYSMKAAKAYRDGNIDDAFVATEMECHVGNTLLRMGKTKEAIDIINKATKYTEQSRRFMGFYSWLNCMSAKASALYDIDSCQAIIPVCDKVLNGLKTMNSLTDIPVYFQEKANIDELNDYYNGLFEAYKSATYAKMNELDSVKAAVQRCLKTEWGKNHEYTSMNLVMAYTALGLREKFDSCYNRFLDEYKNDTLQIRMIYFLECKTVFAKSENNLKEALLYEERAIEVRKEIYNKELSAQIANNAAAFEASMNAKHEKEVAEKGKTIWPIHSIIFALLIIGTIYFYYHIKKIKQIKAAYQSLLEKQRIIETNVQLVKRISDPTEVDMVSVTLYGQIMELMRTKKPYLKEDFSINKLAEMLNTNVNHVSRAINYGSYKKFPQWLAEYRNQIAIKALQENPNLTLNDVCILTGHTTRETFSRQFKAQNGISFSEFREQNQKR